MDNLRGMPITSGETQLAASAVAAVAVGVSPFWAWLGFSFQSKNSAAERLQQRRCEVYQEILIDMDRADRRQKRFSVEGLTGGAQWPVDEIADQEAAYKARVDLYASNEVRGRWNEWLNVFSEGWQIAADFHAAGGIGTGELAERNQEWETARTAAYDAVVAQMRKECTGLGEL